MLFTRNTGLSGSWNRLLFSTAQKMSLNMTMDSQSQQAVRDEKTTEPWTVLETCIIWITLCCAPQTFCPVVCIAHSTLSIKPESPSHSCILLWSDQDSLVVLKWSTSGWFGSKAGPLHLWTSWARVSYMALCHTAVLPGWAKALQVMKQISGSHAKLVTIPRLFSQVWD